MLALVEDPGVQVKFVLAAEQSGRHPPLPPSSQISLPTTKESLQVGKQFGLVKVYFGMHEQLDAVVTEPPEQVKLLLGPEQSGKHPHWLPSSHNSEPLFLPSPHESWRQVDPS